VTSGRLAITVAAVTMVVSAACSPDGSASPSGSVASASPGPTASATEEASPGGLVAIDASLLTVLPPAVDGILLNESPEGEAEALRDPALAGVATRMAAALALDPASGEFVYAVVVAVRPGALDDEAYRDWRDSFDEGACSQAGGVVGRAEAEIGGRTVHIGSCAGGVLTYHVWLREPGLLVSASAVGERRLGERLVQGLRR